MRTPEGTVDWKGRWYARLTVRDASGKTRRPWIDLERPDIPHTDEGREDAKRLARERADLLRAAGGVLETPEPETAPTTMATILDRWFELIKEDPGTLRSTSIEGYCGRLKTHVLPVAKDWQPPFTTQQLRSLFRDLRSTKAASTVQGIANALTRALDDAISEGWMAGENPMRSRDVRKVVPAAKPPEPEDIIALPDGHVFALLWDVRIPQNARDLYLMASASGMRIGELYGMQPQDVQIDAPIPTLNVRRQLLDTKEIGLPKTRWARRTIPLHPLVVPMLRRRISGLAEDAFVFTVGRNDASVRLRGHLIRANMSPVADNGDEYTLHATRRTFSSQLERADVHGDTIDRLLGHSPASMRAKHYSALSIDVLYRAVLKLTLEPMNSTKDPNRPDQSSPASSSTQIARGNMAQHSAPSTPSSSKIGCRSGSKKRGHIVDKTTKTGQTRAPNTPGAESSRTRSERPKPSSGRLEGTIDGAAGTIELSRLLAIAEGVESLLIAGMTNQAKGVLRELIAELRDHVPNNVVRLLSGSGRS